MGLINADPKVMEFFPDVQSQHHTDAFVDRMMAHFEEHGYCYMAVETLEDGEFIGFIGLANQDFESDFTPCVDIGWRLAQSTWGKGYATEGARRCLEFGFEEMKLENIKAICPEINERSEAVMQKIGMTKTKSFLHPLLSELKTLESCLLYEIHR